MFTQIVEDILNEEKFKVTHQALGVSEETDADSKEKAKQNVFFRLKKQGKLSGANAYKWKEASAKPLEEKKQMHCWKGYKKKGTKKLPSGKVVNNCVKA